MNPKAPGSTAVRLALAGIALTLVLTWATETQSAKVRWEELPAGPKSAANDVRGGSSSCDGSLTFTLALAASRSRGPADATIPAPAVGREAEAAASSPPLAGSAGPPAREDTYDIDAKGIPQFVALDYLDVAKISRISRFRSGEGHDYSDSFEQCRSMKHYFQPASGVDWAGIELRSPVAGTVCRLEAERAGSQVRIQSREHPAFQFIVFHVQLAKPLAVGDSVAAGQLLGTHIGRQTMSDIAVGVNTPTGWRLVSYFEVMTEALFDRYRARSIVARSDLIISKAERDHQPLTCVGGSFRDSGTLVNWVTLR